MLEITDLRCGYGGGDVVKGINLNVKNGDILCVVGPNGCGKSTLLKAAARLLPFRGSVQIDGTETRSFSRKELAKKIALLGQNSRLYFPYTVFDTVAMGRYARGESVFGGLSAAGKQSVERVLAVLELEKDRARFISELSGGQLQRVFLARTLVQDPEIILLDEPTNHLDLKHQADLLEYLGRWADSGGTRTVIAVLHDLNLARRFCRQAVLMADGKAAFCGAPEEIFAGPALKEVYGMDVREFMLESLGKWET
ncbi:MAG: ABC transporter ATP-binding protein [Treponema sp.]|jgi:iron complex transport system ATP-binding protein|nr:ABC transporter ATP-binding protein [Treponema sp.]